MLLLGIDVGTSSIKVSVVDAATQKSVVSAQYPETETEIISYQSGWAEQSPDRWWNDVKQAILKANATGLYNPKDVGAIGIAYQMHGLVVMDKEGNVLRHSIIWCDSRAIEIGNAAFKNIGEDKCLRCMLNSPGNFTASKLAWVKENEPELFSKIDKVMLPGDFIAYKLTGSVTTTPSALSEGVFWDFEKQDISKEVLGYFEFDRQIIPEISEVFSEHGKLSLQVADELGLKQGTPVAYKSGDQPNNALSLNVLNAGEVAATAGTSGVIYAVSDQLIYDKQSRVNGFAHVNHTDKQTSIGILLCINGTGISNSWIRQMTGIVASYQQMNELAASIQPGSEGLFILPFGNGAERMLNNKMVGSHIQNIDFNKHTLAHLYRAVQEGISFAFRYGLDIMRENGLTPQIIRAGKANMFLSEVFAQCFVDATGVPVELYENDGSIGAAVGAAIGAKYYNDASEAFTNQNALQTIAPLNATHYNELYGRWKNLLKKELIS